MGIRLFYPFALMSIYLYLLIQTPKTARGQDAMYNDAEKTCSDLSMNTGLRGATQKISESLDNFMDVMIDKFKDLYLSISPPGLYHVLGLLANVADENSKSLQEIEEWMVKKKENKPNDLFNFNRRMKELNFNSSVLYYYPRSLGKPSSKLSFVVKESGGLLFQEKGTVNYQISKKTGERLKNYELPENEKSNVILNIVSFTFQWVEEFYSTSNGQKFKPINADEYTAHTIFTPSEVPYFQAGSEHPLTPNLSAVQLSLKGKDGKKIEGMSVYLIDTNRNQLRMVDWDTAFVGLKKKEKTVKNFEMVAFKLDAEFVFDSSRFTNLLSPGNTEFKSVADTVDLKLTQTLIGCIDQRGSIDKGTVAVPDEKRDLSDEDGGPLFLPPYFFIIAEDSIGLPYLIHEVSSPLNINESC